MSIPPGPAFMPGFGQMEQHPICDHCDNPTVATVQWRRKATAGEAAAHYDAQEANIRAANSGHPAAEWTADRTQPVTRAVFGCADHSLTPPAADNSDEAHAAAEQAGMAARIILHESDCTAATTGPCACTGE